MNTKAAIRNMGLGLVAGALLFAGTSSVTAAPERSSEKVPSDYRVLATLEQGGATFEFVQSSGVIGVAEYGPVGMPTLLTDRATDGATALEVFLALAGPNDVAPKALMDDHKASVKMAGRSDTAPRDLDLSQLFEHRSTALVPTSTSAMSATTTKATRRASASSRGPGTGVSESRRTSRLSRPTGSRT